MPDKHAPEVLAGLAPLWVFLISLLGATVGYLEDFKHDDSPRVMLFKAATRIAGSGFAAVLTWHAILAMGIPEGWHVPIVGIAGHMGVEALKLGGELLRVWLNKRAAQ
jgi:hypothetical protein